MLWMKRVGLALLIVACLIGSLENAMRILTTLCTLALISNLSDARRIDKSSG